MTGRALEVNIETSSSGMAPTLEARAWQGLAATALWLVISLGAAHIALPGWAAPLVLLPSLAISLDTLGPRPLFVRWHLHVPKRPSSVLATTVLGIGLAVAFLTLSAPAPTTDQPYIITCAARDLWHGVDPYNTFEPQCLARLRPRTDAVTPLEQGPFAELHHYPSSTQLALAITRDQRYNSHAGFAAYGLPPEAAILIFPVAFAGWFAISLWVVALTGLLLAAIWARARPWSPPVLAWQVAGLALLWASFRWNPEDIAYLLLALSFARIDRPRVSAVAMAAAICSNPLSWITVPVYLVILARRSDFRARVFWLSGAVLIGVLPWLIWDHALLGELWRFITLPLFPFGASLAALVPPPNGLHWLFTLGLVVGIVACAFVAWRWPRWRWSMAVVVYGSFVLSWQAPLFYVMPILWLSPAVALGACRLERKETVRDSEPADRGVNVLSSAG
jgi:hypothetical protein